MAELLGDDSFMPPSSDSFVSDASPEPSFAPDFVPPEPSFAPPEPSIAPEPSFASPPPPPDSGMDGGMVFASVDEPAADMGAMDMPSPEHMSSALDAFHRKWQAELLAKDEAETSAKLAAVASARAELEKAETERQALREANMTKNRSEEQLLMEQIEADLEAENPWARIIKLVDLQTEHSESSNDVSRMRQIFIQLKNEPPTGVSS